MWIVFSLTEVPAVYIVAAVVGGLAFALAFPAKQALLVQVSPARWLGSVQGIEQMSMQGAAFVGTLTAPLIYGAIGGWIFAVGGAVALTGVVVAAPVLRREWACLQRGDVRSCAQLKRARRRPRTRRRRRMVAEVQAEAETGVTPVGRALAAGRSAELAAVAPPSNSADSTRSLPCCLARYMRASASWMRASTDIGGARYEATPMLQRTGPAVGDGDATDLVAHAPCDGRGGEATRPPASARRTRHRRDGRPGRWRARCSARRG